MPIQNNIQFIIYTPEYNEKIGGVVALHHLCHLINVVGVRAYLHPWVYSGEISALDRVEAFEKATKSAKALSEEMAKPKRTRTTWNTPWYPKDSRFISSENKTIVVYPEVTFGNPLRAKNIARWLLHEPGYHTKQVYYVDGEVQFKYGENITPLNHLGLQTADFALTTLDIPWELFHEPERKGLPRNAIAYAIRKGKGKKISHDLSSSICIDNLSLVEVARVFQRSSVFYSYDTATLFSRLAPLCGCESIIIPDEGVTENQWRPDVRDRYGISYGLGRRKWARETKDQLVSRLKEQENETIRRVELFIEFWNKRLSPLHGV